MYEIFAQEKGMDVDGEVSGKIKELDVLEDCGVRLHYHGDFLDIDDVGRMYLQNVEDVDLHEESIYIMHGIFMQYRKGYLYVSFGGLIGQFVLEGDEGEYKKTNFPKNWYLYVLK